MQEKIKKDETVKQNPNAVLNEKVPHIRSDVGVGIMKHNNGKIEKRKFN